MSRLRRTVALVGMMGAGKSSLGRRLAPLLGVQFRDADSEIEVAAGCSISDVFERFGEMGFREGERKVIARLLREPAHVLATGGGAFIDESTRADIASMATSVWLRAPIELLLTRISRRETRPLLRNGDPRETMERLLRERESIYAMADLVVDSEDGPHQSAIDRLLTALEARDLLEPP
ncbi:MAG TPA: shikimate kinase [Rhizomicrobium sp.]